MREKNWTDKVTDEMKKFEKSIIKAMRVDGWDGHEDESKQKWTFLGSLFYSIVLISTIGYGDQTPKTQWGKVWICAKIRNQSVVVLREVLMQYIQGQIAPSPLINY